MFIHKHSRLKKSGNFFDVKEGEDFETFADDIDFAKMIASKDKSDAPDVHDDDKLGQTWGGGAYSFQKGLNDFFIQGSV
jgi:hypothetical protein